MRGVIEIRVQEHRLDALPEAAAAADAPLLWLLAEGVRPGPGALDALLRHAPGPAASLPVDGRDRPVLAVMGRLPERDAEGILAAIERRCLPLRHTHLVSLLVERDSVLELAAPDPDRFGRYAGCEWTARLFARRRGMLVPASRVSVEETRPGSPLHLRRVARAAGWRKGETVRELQRILAGRTP